MDKWKDKKGHFTNEENDGGECKHYSSQSNGAKELADKVVKKQNAIKVSTSEYGIIKSAVTDKVAKWKAKKQKPKKEFFVRTANKCYRVSCNGYDFRIIAQFDIEQDFEILNKWGDN